MLIKSFSRSALPTSVRLWSLSRTAIERVRQGGRALPTMHCAYLIDVALAGHRSPVDEFRQVAAHLRNLLRNLSKVLRYSQPVTYFVHGQTKIIYQNFLDTNLLF